jgi:hypothetical protein
MTFQDRKITGKYWDKTKEKREELHKRDAVKANHPTVCEQDNPSEKSAEEKEHPKEE